MSTFSVKVRTPSGERHHFDEPGRTAGEVYDIAAARFGYLCSVSVRPK